MTQIGHSHSFLGAGHESSEQRTWAVIWLCGVMMVAEISGGLLFGSIALVADGMHMSTHAGAMLLAALAYRYARLHVDDPRFSFGTGKLGDLAGFTSAIVLAMIAAAICYGSLTRLFAPVPIRFAEAIPIACLGLVVNVASAWLLNAGSHGHAHGHGHGHGHDHGSAEVVMSDVGPLALEIFEDGVPPRFRLTAPAALPGVNVATLRTDGSRQVFALADRGAFLESVEEIPEPHEFTALINVLEKDYPVVFEEAGNGHAGRDNNMRAALVHVMADAAVSVLVIAGLLAARAFGWLWMDPLAGLVGAAVIVSWAWGLVRDTGAILLDMTPDRALAARMVRTIEAEGDEVADLHVWRLGPGHLGAIVSVRTGQRRDVAYYRTRLASFSSLSHLTIEVLQGS